MRHVWHGGDDALDPARLAALAAEVAPARDPSSDAVKAELRALGDEAVARGLFGVPTFELDGRLYWGFDALPMLKAALEGDAWFDGPAWEAADSARAGTLR
jgi:2-hydroxychromene-2-carboxylate isomerase